MPGAEHGVKRRGDISTLCSPGRRLDARDGSITRATERHIAEPDLLPGCGVTLIGRRAPGEPGSPLTGGYFQTEPCSSVRRPSGV